MTVVVRSRKGDPLPDLAAWHQFAPPAGKHQWVEGRSAVELARAWTEGDGEQGLRRLLDSHPQTSVLEISHATAEAQVSFDAYSGGKRNHDLLVHAMCQGGPTAIGVEGKADETFGQTVGAYHAAAQKLVAAGNPTNAPLRLQGLLADLAGTTLDERPELGALRYQLLSGIAGTLAAAKTGQAVFLVHEFVTDKTSRETRDVNHADLALALRALFELDAPTEGMWLAGPVRVPAARWSAISLWIGHLRSITPSASARN
jgi:hypothetical protein